MDVYDVVWVRWGAGHMGGHKNNACRAKKGRAKHIFGPMAGEISPNIMLCDGKQKVEQMGAGGYKWVHMGGAWCRGTDGTKNKRNRRLNDRAGHVLQG